MLELQLFLLQLEMVALTLGAAAHILMLPSVQLMVLAINLLLMLPTFARSTALLLLLEKSAQLFKIPIDFEEFVMTIGH